MNDFIEQHKKIIYIIIGVVLFLYIYALYMQRTANVRYTSSEGSSPRADSAQAGSDIQSAGKQLSDVNQRLERSSNTITNVQSSLGEVQSGLGASEERINNISTRAGNNSALIAEGRQLIQEGLQIVRTKDKGTNQSKDHVPDNNSIGHSGSSAAVK